MTGNEEQENQQEAYSKKIDYDPTKIDKEQLKNAPKHLWSFFKSTLSIKNEVDVKQTIKVIKANIEFKGASIWVLICSIVVACIGLNSNSTAVIIGAMLISPLMGPIRGMGLAIATNDFKTLISSLINFGVMVGVSFLAAWLYFLITPIKTATIELESRVHPQALDVLIGFFGGLAGIIASATGDRSTVVPGVAIATALMPPICTAGYGLALGEFAFFFGALYLFLLNTVFICLSTYLTLRYLNFPLMEFVNPRTEKKVKLYSSIVLLAIVVPSIWFFIKLVKENQFEESVNAFVRDEIQVGNSFDNVELDGFVHNFDSSIVYLKVLGGYIDLDQEKEWETKMRENKIYDRLRNTDIQFKNNKKPKEVKSGFISHEMYQDQRKTKLELEESNRLLIGDLTNYKEAEINSTELANLIKTNYGELIDSVECGPMYLTNLEGKSDTTSRYIVYWNTSMSDSLINLHKGKLEQHIKLNMDKKNPKFLHISSYGKE